MGNWHWDGRENFRTSYCRFLQQESHTRDVTRAMSRETARLIGSQETFSRAQIETTERGFAQLSGSMARQTEALQDGLMGVSWSVDRLGDRISGEIADLRATFDWGFSHLLAGMGAMRDTLESLVRIAKTPAQTAAYEQFEIARDAFRQGLFPECLESLDRAVNGDQTSPGYKLEWRFHNLRGIVRLGSRENFDPSLVDPAAAEEAFVLAARYARADHSREAAVALLSASWAAWVRNDIHRSLEHAEAAAALDPGLSEALFQASKAQMALDAPGLALPALRAAVDQDPLYLVKAGSDPDFQKHEASMRSFLRALREEKVRALGDGAREWLGPYQTAIARCQEVGAHPVVLKWKELAAGAEDWGLLDLLRYERCVEADRKKLAALLTRLKSSIRVKAQTMRTEREVDEPYTVEERYQDTEEYVEEVDVPRKFLFWTWTQKQRVSSQRPVTRTRQVEKTRRVKGVEEAQTLVVVDGLGEPVTAVHGFAVVPAGRFLMGSPEGENGRCSDEGPQHEVVISRPFLLGVAPVTQTEWQAVMGANPSSHKGGDRPVENVSWLDAVAFCNRLSEQVGLRPVYRISGTDVAWDRAADGFRLPTEAEWEYACRAGTTGARYGEIDAIAWYSANSGGETHPVRQMRPNAWGLHDMLGNVWEWVWDWKADYSSGTVTDPVGPATGSFRVPRGGSWNFEARCVRVAYRFANDPGYRSSNLGFRLSRSGS
jgi:formylglycine-generating enzyme required for sulfatase activity/tetratricopeptide (TPR) repeat protein